MRPLPGAPWGGVSGSGDALASFPGTVSITGCTELVRAINGVFRQVFPEAGITVGS
jgi:hypothetical protein